MKAIFMKMLEEEYQGDTDAYIQEMARVSLEEVIQESYDVVTKHVCPNCYDKSYLHSMIQKEDEIECYAFLLLPKLRILDYGQKGQCMILI